MIVFDIACDADHRFEGWFASAAAFEDQRTRGLIACPFCESTSVVRALSVPRIATGRSTAPELIAKLAALQGRMLKGSTWVGDDFASQARAMADGDKPVSTIHGRATIGQARSLVDDGIKVTALPFPVIPPEQCN